MTVAFLGERILSMDPAVDAPEAVVVTGDRIAAVGDRGILDGHPDTQVVDVARRTLMPGFVARARAARHHPRHAGSAGRRDRP